MKKLHIIILAAGKGTRMKSSLPKVLSPLAKKPLLAHVIDTTKKLDAASVNVVVGHKAEQVMECFKEEKVNWIIQKNQSGTGNAVKQAIPNLADNDNAVILYGDVPLISHETLTKLTKELDLHALSVLTADLKKPTGYGRIKRDDNNAICRIVEQKDATVEEQEITEINTGFLAANVGKLKQWLALTNTDNAQGEEYLPDVVNIAYQQNEKIIAVKTNKLCEIQGINSKIELAVVERQFQQLQAEQCMQQGMTLIDPARFDLRGSLNFGQDCWVDINSIFNGDVTLGNNVTIHANCILTNCHVGDNSVIHPNTILENCHIGAQVNVGPFARIRPGTSLNDHSKVGNFVELKNTQLSIGSKINHLSYVGDCQIGEDTNIGAGVITCNYDGVNKHQTIIGDNAFIGSNAQLVAPVIIESGATVAAGSTITQTVPKENLAVARSKQKNLSGWQRPKKK